MIHGPPSASTTIKAPVIRTAAAMERKPLEAPTVQRTRSPFLVMATRAWPRPFTSVAPLLRSFAVFNCFARKCTRVPSSDAVLSLLSHSGFPLARSASRPGEQPHEEQLDKVRVEKEKLRSLVPFHPGVGLHRTSRVGGRLRQKDVLERSHLKGNPVSTVPTSRSVHSHTRKRELARKV